MSEPNHISRLQRYLAEFLGTFMLVFVGTGAIVVDTATGGEITHLGVALAFGLTIMFIIYSIGHISGAHVNPAVTLAFATVRRFPPLDIVPYWSAQVSGALAASVVLRLFFGDTGELGATASAIGAVPGLIVEILIGFVLMFVIISVATDTRAVGEAAAIAIGGTLAALVLFAGPLTGASLNPARSIGPAVISGRVGELWIYLIGPTVGLMLGALVYQLLRERRARKPEVGFGGKDAPADRQD
jgi:MIP family channel proteins